MKILKTLQGKTIMAEVQSPDNKQFQFFQKIKKDLGIIWNEISDFKIVNTIFDNHPAQLYEKTIVGSRKGSIMKQSDYSIHIKFICLNSNGLEEKQAEFVLKSFATNAILAKWITDRKNHQDKASMDITINNILKGQLGLSGLNLETPTDFDGRINVDEMNLQPVDIGGREGYYYHRLTRIKTNAYNASVLELYVRKSRFGYKPFFSATYFEMDKASGERSIDAAGPTNVGTAIKVIDKSVNLAKKEKGYVGPESPLYIPEGATKENWDFVLHTWKNTNMQSQPQIESQPKIQTQPQPESTENVENQESSPYVVDLKKLFGQKQDFEGYFSGEIPDYAGSLIGTPSVDASQISSMFGGTSEAVALVNNYTSDALKNVAYIFNFSKGGAYGVYIPVLDKAIKTKALKKQLEQKGYKIVEENGVLTAHPTKEETTADQIDKDIHDLWEQLNSQGGSALGINMANVLRATDENTSKIMSDLRNEVPDAPQQIEQALRDVLGIYHLAAIILHEASHSKGGDEGKAQADEQAFRSWAQGYLNQQYKSKLSGAGLDEFYSPLELGTETLHAASKNWYKIAQGIMGRLPQGGSAKAQGSDIRGRYQGNWQSQGFADWAMLAQQDQSIPIEQRLNRGKMAILERDVDQENDIIEEQLRKQFRNDSKPNVQLITEELLAPSRNEAQGYKMMETMLEELRPQPLMTTLKKAAMSEMVKTSRRENSLFGWYNNLDLADGSTIPGLSDRVMAWDDRDESFSSEESSIKSQSRYNPEYDLKGFYYRWIEPRFKPQLFDDMTQDYSNTSPAKRFAAKLDPTLSRMLSVIKLIEEEIINEKIKSTRIVITEDLVDIIKRLLDQEGINLKAYKVSNSEDVFAIWAYNNSVSGESIDKVEQYFQNIDGSEQYKDLAEDLLNGKSIISTAVEEIVKTVKELCKEYNVDDIYIIGEYARKIFEGESLPVTSELDFACESIDAGLKLGSILASKLNVPNDFVIMGNAGITFPYKGIRVFFSKSQYYPEIGEKMQEHGYNCEDPVLRDICNKDFTVNMMAYDILNMKVLDPIGVKSDIKNKIAKTLFDPSFIIGLNPMVIMRGVALRIDGYTLDEDLERSMIEGATSLKSGRFSPERLKFTREYIRSKGTSVAEDIFNEYGIDLCEKEI